MCILYQQNSSDARKSSAVSAASSKTFLLSKLSSANMSESTSSSSSSSSLMSGMLSRVVRISCDQQSLLGRASCVWSFVDRREDKVSSQTDPRLPRSAPLSVRARAAAACERATDSVASPPPVFAAAARTDLPLKYLRATASQSH